MKKKKVVIIIVSVIITLTILAFALIILNKRKNIPLENVYNDFKYGFAMEIPENWKLDYGEYMQGPLFTPQDFKANYIKEKKYNARKDCFFNISYSGVINEIYCANKLGEISLGENYFIQCRELGEDENLSIKYYILHPKTKKLIKFSYLDNRDCKVLFEQYLATLKFEK